MGYDRKLFSSFYKEPDDNECHVYYAHQDGRIFCVPNVPVAGSASPGEEILCGVDRLTLIQLPRFYFPEDRFKYQDLGTQQVPTSCEQPQIPNFFREMLLKGCGHCEYKGSVLWGNFHSYASGSEEYFDNSAFRFYEPKEQPQSKCFMNFYKLRITFPSQPAGAVFSMVHHIKVRGGRVVNDPDEVADTRESMVAFIAGLTSSQISECLTSLTAQWQDSEDTDRRNRKTSAGLTPRLLVAGILSQCGTLVSPTNTGRMLKDIDGQLQKCIDSLPSGASNSSDDTTDQIRSLNQVLVNRIRNLVDTRSPIHCLADIAQRLFSNAVSFVDSIRDRLDENGQLNYRDVETLKEDLYSLDSFLNTGRDNSKLEAVKNAMLHYQVEVDSLQEHIKINIEMARNVVAEWARSIQLEIARNADQDNTNMKIIAILTALFLPGTFMAVLLTTPMFNWLEPDKPVIVRLPFEIYWGVTGSVTVLLAVGLFIMIHTIFISKVLVRLVDCVPFEGFRTLLQKGRLYLACLKRLQRNRDAGSDVVRSAKSKRDARDKDVARKGKMPVRSNKEVTGSQASDIEAQS